jgi:hypothetical protein
MNQRNKRWTMVAIAAALSTAAVAGAQTMSNLPPEQKQGSIAYLSGGVGDEQRTAIKDAARNYALELEFVQGGKAPRAFLSGVKVEIKDSSGHTVLSTLADGPLLLAKLPSGSYSITATHMGSSESKSVVVAEGKLQHVLFDWK